MSSITAYLLCLCPECKQKQLGGKVNLLELYVLGAGLFMFGGLSVALGGLSSPSPCHRL